MQKIVLQVDVQGEELDQLNSELQKTEQNFRDTQKAADGVNKSVDDVASNGGAIATLDRLTGGAASQMRDLFESTKLFNLSLKGTRTALIATGIGAFVVALGVVVAYWDEIADAIKGVTENLEAQLKVTKSNIDVLSGQLAIIEKQLELNELQGVANEELEKQRIAILVRLQEQNEAEQKLLENQIERLRATATELSMWEMITIKIKQSIFGADAVASETTKLAAQRLEEINALEAALADAQLKAVDLNVTLFKIRNPEGETVERENTEGVLDPNLKSDQAVLLDQYKEFEVSRTEIEQVESDNRIEIARLEAKAKIEATQQYGNILSSIGNTIGKQTKAGKLAAAAGALISTYFSAQKAYESQLLIPTPSAPIRAIAAAGAAIAAGLKNVKAITSVKTPGGGGGASVGGGTNAFSGADVQTPNFNVVGNSGVNQLADVVNNTIKEPTRAFVVFDDIRDANEMNNASRAASSV